MTPRAHGPRRSRFALLAIVVTLAAMPAIAGDWLYVEGIVDGEGWDAGGDRYGINGGDPLAIGRVHLWAAAEPLPKLSFFALGMAEHGFGEEGEATLTRLEQAVVRFETGSVRPFSLEAGRIVPPMGEFARRHLSTVNPLIGSPAGGYYVDYPEGVRAAGAVGRFDWQAAILDAPPYAGPYVPEPDRAVHPLVGAGVTIVTGLRVGLSFSRGPYLNQELAPLLPPGTGWKGFDQDSACLELSFSRGYLEMHGELLMTWWDVPLQTSSLEGRSSYLEAKYTWRPRWFSAIRVGRTRYPYVLPMSPSRWLGFNAAVADAEIGLGYRIGPETILKASFRTERWDEGGRQYHEGGNALAVQVSHQFDVKSWFRPAR